LPNYLFIRGIDASFDLFGGKLIEGVAGNDAMPFPEHLGIKIRWPIGTSENAVVQISVRQLKDTSILIERASPGHYIFVFEGHVHLPMTYGKNPSCPRRTAARRCAACGRGAGQRKPREGAVRGLRCAPDHDPHACVDAGKERVQNPADTI
jgi:hypothetical protein